MSIEPQFDGPVAHRIKSFKKQRTGYRGMLRILWISLLKMTSIRLTFCSMCDEWCRLQGWLTHRHYTSCIVCVTQCVLFRVCDDKQYLVLLLKCYMSHVTYGLFGLMSRPTQCIGGTFTTSEKYYCNVIVSVMSYKYYYCLLCYSFLWHVC